jgi:hypothetical protein
VWSFLRNVATSCKIAIFESKFYTALAVGFFFSFVLCVVIGIFAGTFKYDKDTILKIENVSSVFDGNTIIFLFMTLGFAISIVGYISKLKESEDSYTWLRKRLVGTWNFQLETWRLDEEAAWQKQHIIYTAILQLDPQISKLNAQVHQFGHDFFQNAISRTDLVHISGGGSDYTVVALLSINQTIKAQIVERFEEKDFSMKILIELNIDVTDKNNISKMKGTWYDIDNVMWRVIEQYEKKERIDDLWESFKDGVYNFQGEVIAEKIVASD